MEPKVTIIILNWNGWHDTIECLESLYQIEYTNYDVIVVDNKSEDDSLNKIQTYCEGKLKVNSKFFDHEPNNKPIEIYEYFQEELEHLKPNPKNSHLISNKKLTIIKNDENYGFAKGNNIGMRYALKNLDPDYILLLNNDTVVDKNFLDEMIKNSEIPEIGFIGPKIYYYNYNGRNDFINFAGGRLNLLNGSAKHIGIGEIDNGQYDQTKKVDYVEGSCILIKKEVLYEVGLLDAGYFAYWEEIDLCMRGLKQNYFSLYVPNSKIWHKISSSSDEVTKIYYLTRNSLWFTKKYAKNTQYVLFIVYFLLFEFWFKCLFYALYHKDKSFISFIKGVKDGIKSGSLQNNL